MSLLRAIWHELTRPRGPVKHRFYRNRRRSQSGIALLITITTLLFLTVLVTEIGFAATVRVQLARHTRDEAKAEAIASTGIHIWRLILVASKGLGKNPMIQQFEQMLGMDLGDMLWQMIPPINTGLMRMIFVAGGDDDQLEELQAAGLSDQQLDESRQSSSMTKSFLDFEGDFYAEVTDEDRKINVSSFRATNPTELQTDPVAVQLHGLMSGQRACPNPWSLEDEPQTALPEEVDDLDRFFLDLNMDRWELIGNLADWTDADNSRLFDGGSEDTLYNTLDRDPYLPKNAGFDTFEEIRQVEGWHLDSVWEKFGDDITVFGNGKINVNTAECDVMWGLLKSYVQPTPNDDQTFRLMQAIEEQKALMTFSDANQFVTFLQSQGVQVDPSLKSVLSTESRVFRVTSTGQVGSATVNIEAIIDFTSAQTGQIVYWRVR